MPYFNAHNYVTTYLFDNVVLDTYAVGDTPYDITYDPTNNAVWAANSGSNNVTKLTA